MIMNSPRENNLQENQEVGRNKTILQTKPKVNPSTSRQWSSTFKNPRIVRVSRTFGGKDRHSKVCTVRGLRDRRIRLSVPTAIQLYDLQDRLGLGQPSKVVDWLIEATKDEIDRLPPLQFPPGSFTRFLEPAQTSQFDQFLNPNTSYNKDGGANLALSSKDWIKIGDQDVEIGQLANRGSYKDKWIPSIRAENQESGNYMAQFAAQNFFPISGNQPPMPSGLLNSSNMPYNNYFQWGPSSLSLSQFGTHTFPTQTEDPQNNPSITLPSSSSSGSHLLFCPPPPPSVFPAYTPYMANSQLEGGGDQRQTNHFHWLTPSSQQPTLHLIGNSKVLFSQGGDASNQTNKGKNGFKSWKQPFCENREKAVHIRTFPEP